MAEANPQSLPTRTPPITDLENILRNCIYITLQPKVEPSEVSTYLDIDIYLIERMFLTEESYLEGILRNTSNPDYAQFLLVFRDTFNEERHAKRLQICASQLKIEWSPGSEIIYVGRSSGLKDYEVTNTAFFEVMKSNLVQCLTRGKPFSPDFVWYAQPSFVVTSTPDTDPKPGTLDQLMAGLQDQDDRVIKQLYLALASEAKDRGLVPKPQPIPPQNTSFDVEELGKTLAKANKDFVAALATQGMIKTSPLKLHPFSGSHLKEDVSFEQWAYEVRLALKTHTEGSVREAMIQCLKGATLEGVRNLGDEASVEDILEYLTGTFQGAAPFDTLLKNFFQLQQEDSEKVAQYSIKLESKLASLKWQYPHALSSETELQYKRDRLFYGLHKNIRDSIRSSYKNPQITYAELLRAAREIEEELGENSPQESKPDKKAKVASTTVSSSTATELSKLAEVTLKCSQEQEKACKLMNELISLLKNNLGSNSNTQGNGSGYRGRGRGGFRGGRGGRGNGRGNQHQSQQRGQNGGSGNGQQDQPRGANGDQGQANRARTPFCFYCKKQKADKTDHWPSQCQLLGNILSDWHAGESQSGHQDHQGNSSGQH